MILEMLQFMVYTKEKPFTDLSIGISFIAHGIELGKNIKKSHNRDNHLFRNILNFYEKKDLDLFVE
jgi:hypothetical protein